MTDLYDPDGKILKLMQEVCAQLEFNVLVSATSNMAIWDCTAETFTKRLNVAMKDIQILLNMTLVREPDDRNDSVDRFIVGQGQ